MFYIRHTSPRSIQALLQPSRKSGPQSLPIVTFQGKALSKPEDPNDTFHRAIPPENNNNSDLNLDDILPPKPKHRRRDSSESQSGDDSEVREDLRKHRKHKVKKKLEESKTAKLQAKTARIKAEKELIDAQIELVRANEDASASFRERSFERRTGIQEDLIDDVKRNRAANQAFRAQYKRDKLKAQFEQLKIQFLFQKTEI